LPVKEDINDVFSNERIQLTGPPPVLAQDGHQFLRLPGETLGGRDVLRVELVERAWRRLVLLLLFRSNNIHNLLADGNPGQAQAEILAPVGRRVPMVKRRPALVCPVVRATAPAYAL